MPDKGKVIRGINKCLHRFHCDADCPYYGEGCMEQLLEDTLELLKEQEPRLLKLEEAKKAEICWLEQRGYEPFATFDAYTWNPETYGKSYRCWNCMPTDEQRKEEEWNV